jgi:hypothetical protein
LTVATFGIDDGFIIHCNIDYASFQSNVDHVCVCAHEVSYHFVLLDLLASDTIIIIISIIMFQGFKIRPLKSIGIICWSSSLVELSKSKLLAAGSGCYVLVLDYPLLFSMAVVERNQRRIAFVADFYLSNVIEYL